MQSTSRKSLIHMLGVIYPGKNEGWTERRWFTEEPIARATSPTKARVPIPTHVDVAEKHARRIINAGAAGNPIGRRVV